MVNYISIPSNSFPLSVRESYILPITMGGPAFLWQEDASHIHRHWAWSCDLLWPLACEQRVCALQPGKCLMGLRDFLMALLCFSCCCEHSKHVHDGGSFFIWALDGEGSESNATVTATADLCSCEPPRCACHSGTT